MGQKAETNCQTENKIDGTKNQWADGPNQKMKRTTQWDSGQWTEKLGDRHLCDANHTENQNENVQNRKIGITQINSKRQK